MQQLLQVVWVAGEVQDEGGASDLLGDVLVQQLHVLLDLINVGLLVDLKQSRQLRLRCWKGSAATEDTIIILMFPK